VLAIIAVVTLLRPESNTPLSGIRGNPAPTIAQGPGGPGGSHNGGPTGAGNSGHGSRPTGHNGHQGENGPKENGRHHGQGSTGVPTGTATASVGGSPAAVPPAVTETSPTRAEGGAVGGTPTEDQYADSIDSIDSAQR
jgi:hypothetical protein